MLTERCRAAGRSDDPAAPNLWEGMAALAALSPTGERVSGEGGGESERGREGGNKKRGWGGE